MENIIEALEMGIAIILFCFGIYTMIFLDYRLEKEYENFSNTIYENRMIGKD